MDERLRAMAWRMFFRQKDGHLRVANIEQYLNQAYLLGRDDAVEHHNRQVSPRR